MTIDTTRCELCGEAMPEGETMFKFHGYSGPCPKPPLPIASPQDRRNALANALWMGQEHTLPEIQDILTIHLGEVK